MATNGPQLPSQVNTEIVGSAMQTNGASGVQSKPPKLRKRTKTGCLTCRKRRIKCGEERPTCGNCIKSKRHCEGYNQRVIFKPPIGDWPNAQHGGTNTIPFHTGQLPGARPSFHSQQVGQLQNPSLTPLRPRLECGFSMGSGHDQATELQSSMFFDGSNWSYGNGTGPHIPQAGRLSESTSSDRTAVSAAQFKHVSFGAAPVPLGIIPPHDQQCYQHKTPYSAGVPPPLHSPAPIAFDHNGYGPQHPYHPSTHAQHFQNYVQIDQYTKKECSISPTTASDPQSQDHASRVDIPQHQRPQDNAMHRQYGAKPSPVMRHSEYAYGVQQRQDMRVFLDNAHTYEPILKEPLPPKAEAISKPFGDRLLTHGFAVRGVSPTRLLEEAAVENEDDDYFDVESDDEMDDTPVGGYRPSGHLYQPNISMMLALHRESISDLNMRRYDAFIYAGILDHYRAEWVANPLKNPQTARVFAHFVYATGPMISIFERNPRNSSAMFTESPIPNTQQSLWTYTLPMMALHHQGLLHAMLAIASLHIARLQGASTTPSYKHYAYALKRIHHCVGHPKKRHLVTTLAASLLLGYYEVVTADHLKWSSHLIGASQLVQEIDYPGMTKEYRRMEAERGGYDRQFAFENPDMLLNPRQLNSSFHNSSLALDEDLISNLIGKKLRYDEFGRVIDESNPQRAFSLFPRQLDPTKYELFQDLFWWYCRQDVYRSILSGNKLLMDYSKWSNCPPRARMGRLDAVYGTHDHLLLILGRVADFASRDRRRKIKVIESNGGVWKPPPDFSMGPRPGTGPQRPSAPPPSGAPQLSPRSSHSQGMRMPSFSSQPGPGPSPQNQPQPPPMPSFYGMAPSLGTGRMPPSYAPDEDQSPTSDCRQDNFDLKASTAAAIEEWQQIQAAMNVLRSHFGPDYRPLSAEYYPPLITPFGEALHYRSYDIGVTWAIYYMCQIILTRSHPSMPPAAMMAAGVTAAQTAHFANEIGRIASGIIPTPANQPLNPSLGAALVEVTMPLFFAGVQYTDAAQRAWLVSRISEVEVRTGWASAGLIARGCETAWVKAAQAGRGPPYQRRMERESSDERISRKGEHASEPPKDLADRRFIYVNAGTRVHWALGILSAEEDVRRIEEMR